MEVIRIKGAGAYGFILPALLGMGFAIIAVNVFTIYISTTNWGPGHPILENADFVGARNYEEIFHGDFTPHFLGVFSWTLLFALSTLVIAFFLGLFLASILNNPRLRFRNLYRVLLIIPWALPATITILAWRGLLAPYGLFGGAWLTDPNLARISVLVVNIWTAFPFMMCVALGALQSIPPSVYEAAAIDGASRWRRFRRITLPLLRSAMLPVLIFTFAFHFNNFTAVYMLTGGGPVPPGVVSPTVPGSSDLLITYSYNLAFGRGSFYAMAAAFSVVIFIIIAVLTFINFKLTRTFEEATC
ncbi:MAG: sugar ABC transporter permease [Hadesarchaea archaeon]|nr:sugar ABC transporter permease [Hadesarchaea archaeon]